MAFFRRRKRREAAAATRADISALADDGASEELPAEEGPPGEPEPDQGAQVLTAEEAAESRASAERARAAARSDDRVRQTVFACACTIAGFCGVAGIIMGTTAVVGRMDRTPPAALATGPGYAQTAPAGTDIYYGQDGRTHVNIYVTKKPDIDVNISIDQDGNVTAESVPRTEDTDPDTTPPEGDGAGEQKPPEQEPPAETGNKPGTSEEQLLQEMRDRQAAGQSGFLESDGTYVVVWKDTLTKISNMTGFSVDFLAEYNHIADKNLILVGEVIRYPTFDG